MPAVSLRQHWLGLASLKHLVVFGASYCDVGYNRKAPHPTLETPLGVKYPGTTWCGRFDRESHTYIHEPNWVGHIINLSQASRVPSSLLVYDYALGGDRVDGVERQIRRDFLPDLAPKPDWAPWTSDDTLFICWVGINDCVWNAQTSNPEASTKASLELLFSSQDELYRAGARNFCFIDVPPVYDFPEQRNVAKLKDVITAWNGALFDAAEKFSADHADATVLVWSSWKLFTELLTSPQSYGFGEGEAVKEEGDIFEDGLHPSTQVHRLVAKRLFEFLSEASEQVHEPDARA
ncbi:hypothetical protein C8Q79DRAFT_906407 [Trametes meyenii]|nr:hypothetical protein C8Q79DRAFT_906407 [Trametes meyenii]